MCAFPLRRLGAALPALLASHMALADVTPQQVWDDWRSYLEDFGYEISGTEGGNANELIIRDLQLDIAPDTSGATMSADLGELAFVQNDDGSVTVVMEDNIPVTITGRNPETDTPFSVDMEIRQGGHGILASGDPGTITYLYDAGVMEITLSSLPSDGGGQDGSMVMTAEAISIETTMTSGDLRSYQQAGSIESVSYEFVVPPAGENQAGIVSGSMLGVTMDGAGLIPNEMETGADMAAMIRAGFEAGGSFSYDSGSAFFDIDDPENGKVILETSSDGGELSVVMGPDGLSYGGGQTGLSVSLTTEMFPFPFEIAMAESGFNLAMPVMARDEPQPFAFGIAMADFTMSDVIWSMFDPAAQLPRDPASLIVDLSGQLKLLQDWIDPEAMADNPGMPGELQALTINDITLDAVGALFQGNGDVTFDGAGPGPVPGLGSPVGSLSLALSGGNALLDKLVTMGLLPQDQAMGARMMMGLFAVPGDAPDTLNSEIEFTPDGQILANGQRLR